MMKFATLFGAALLLAGSVGAAELAVKNGDKIAFLGDSITQQGDRADGYLTMTMTGLKAAGVKASKIAAGIGGHKSPNMLARLDKDVLSKKPQVMVLSCGVNDVWHQFYKKPNGVSLEDYQKNIGEIVKQAQAAGAKVIIMTSTMIYENAKGKENEKLAEYNQFLREYAAANNCILADQNAAMQKMVADYRTKYPKLAGKMPFITTDGVHMNTIGNKMMAMTLLQSFGLDADQLAKAETAINAMSTNMTATMSVADFEAVANQAYKAEKKTANFAGDALKNAAK